MWSREVTPHDAQLISVDGFSPDGEKDSEQDKTRQNYLVDRLQAN